MGETVPETIPGVPGGYGYDCSCWATGKTPLYVGILFSNIEKCGSAFPDYDLSLVNTLHLCRQYSFGYPCLWQKKYIDNGFSFYIQYRLWPTYSRISLFNYEGAGSERNIFYSNTAVLCEKKTNWTNDLVGGGCGAYQIGHNGTGTLTLGET